MDHEGFPLVENHLDRDPHTRKRRARVEETPIRHAHFATVSGVCPTNASDAIREDLDNRTRNVRKHAAPEIVARLGPRPTDPERDWQWDRIAARVDQHRAAYQPAIGLLGRDNIYYPTAENDSIRALKNAINELDRTLRPEQRRQRGIDHGIDYGIEM